MVSQAFNLGIYRYGIGKMSLFSIGKGAFTGPNQRRKKITDHIVRMFIYPSKNFVSHRGGSTVSYDIFLVKTSFRFCKSSYNIL